MCYTHGGTRANTPALRVEGTGMGELLTVEATCELLGCGRARIYELFAAGELPSFKIGRRRMIRREDIDALIERRIAAGR